MLISHEVPKQLLLDSLTFNDYNYLLAHFYDQDPDYQRIFQKGRGPVRFTILDNSIMELGEAFKAKDFFKIVKKVEPNLLVIPDVFNDARGTLENVKAWNRDYQPLLPSYVRTMGVVQGNTYEELTSCFMSLVNSGVNCIGINFGSAAYDTIKFADDKYLNRAYGRHYFITSLFMRGLLKQGTYIHLLGANVPQEFALYSKTLFKYIGSCDTSNPIIAGMNGIRYQDHGMDTKPIGNINDLYLSDVTDEMYNIIINNVRKFREFADDEELD